MPSLPQTVHLGFGSNLGDREASYRQSIEKLGSTTGVKIARFSSLLENPPMGPPQPDYLNGVIEISTTLSPHDLLEQLQLIETKMGRTRDVVWGPRTVDLDILFWGSKILDSDDLKIPHPGACERRFVLEPLAEIAPDFIDPRSGRSISEILETL